MLLTKKDTSIPWDRYWALVKPKYVYIKITPDKGSRNFTSDSIARTINTTYKSIVKRVKLEQKKLWIETNYKISYVIDISQKSTEFFFIIPECHLGIILSKIRDTWPKVATEVVEKIRDHSKNVNCYELAYKNEDALSLNVNKSSNDPLNGILGAIQIMKDDDRATLIYNFQPRDNYGWSKISELAIDRFKKGQPMIKDKTSTKNMILSSMSFFITVIELAMEAVVELFTDTPNSEINILASINRLLHNNIEPSEFTKKKKDSNVINGQIVLLTDGLDETRKEEQALVIGNAFSPLAGDNEIIRKKIKKNFDIEDYRFKNVTVNTFSADECHNFIQVPGRSLLLDYNINHLKVNENPIPEVLTHGYFCLGVAKLRGKVINTFMEDEYNAGNLPLLIIGQQGSGKSTFTGNIYRFAQMREEGGVLIDFIKNNELTDEVLKMVDLDRVVLLDYTKSECIQGLAFNEINVNDFEGEEKLKLANRQAQLILELVNAVCPGNELAPRMRKYLVSAATIVFCTGESSLKEVVKCLECCDTRWFYISSILEGDKTIKKRLQNKIKQLCELDEYSKPSKDNPNPQVVGTKESRIDGILDRISLLNEDVDLEYMFDKGGDKNIDLAKELEKGKLIILKMPQQDFSKHAINVITTFFVSKIWLSSIKRGQWNKKPKRTYVCIDEIFQTPTAMSMLKDTNMLQQTRKFGCKFCFTTQTLQQIEPLLDPLEGGGASYMLLKGTKEKDFDVFAKKAEGFDYSDLSNMEKFDSLNIINYKDGFSSFITRLPKPRYRNQK